MAFSAQELDNIASASLDFHIRGKAMSQSIQDKPLLDELTKGQKTFPGGKGNIDFPVKGVYTTQTQGYTHNDTVNYQNPANIKRAVVPWKEIHAGISLTLTELKIDGISVSDSTTSESTSEHSEREMVAITNLLDDKIEDMMEGWARGMNTMLWRNGVQDSKEVPGITSFLSSTPTTGTAEGIDRAANSWWRNRTDLAISTATPSDNNLVNALQKGLRQQRRFGGKPNKLFAGSAFLEALEKELRSKGNYTLEGWNKKQDPGMGDIYFKGIPVVYDPTLDDNINATGNLNDTNLSKYGFLLDMSHIYIKVMEGEDRKQHTPARPENQYVMYRAMTWTGGLCCDMMNAQGIYSIA